MPKQAKDAGFDLGAECNTARNVAIAYLDFPFLLPSDGITKKKLTSNKAALPNAVSLPNVGIAANRY